MGSFFGDIGNALKKGVKDIGNEAKRDYDRVANPQKADPRKFSNTSTPVTTSTNSSSNFPTTTQPPGGPTPGNSFASSHIPQGAPSGFNEQAFENQLRTDPDLAGVWQGIVNAGGDVWGFLGNFLPKNADGSVDWGKIGSDVAGFVKNNAKTIIDGAAAYANYQRQNKSDAYAKQALQMAQDTYNQNAPLRDQGRANMLNPSANTPDLSAIKALATQNSGNPFAKGLPMASIATKPGQVVPPISIPASAGGSSAPLNIGALLHPSASGGKDTVGDIVNTSKNVLGMSMHGPNGLLSGGPAAPPSQPLTNPVPNGGASMAPLQMAGTPNTPPTPPTTTGLAPRPKPLTLAPQSPALAAPPIASGLQPSRAVLPFAYE